MEKVKVSVVIQKQLKFLPSKPPTNCGTGGGPGGPNLALDLAIELNVDGFCNRGVDGTTMPRYSPKAKRYFKGP